MLPDTVSLAPAAGGERICAATAAPLTQAAIVRIRQRVVATATGLFRPFVELVVRFSWRSHRVFVRMKWIRLSPLVLLLVLVGCGSDQVRLSQGDVAPDFTLADLTGNTVRLADLRGEVVAVHFWAEQCRFCEGEMRWLESSYQQLRAEGFELLAVNAGQDRKTAQGFIDRVKIITYPTLLDDESMVTKRYGVIVLPTTLLVDRKGIVRHKIIGESEPATFESLVRELTQEG